MTELSAVQGFRTQGWLEVVIGEPNGEDSTRDPYLRDVLIHLAILHTVIERVDRAIAVQDVLDGRRSGSAEEEARTVHVNLIKVRRISMNSPLTLDLVLSSSAVIAAVVYLFKNPDKIGEWFPKLQQSWYSGRVEAEKAKREFERLRKSKTEMRELEP